MSSKLASVPIELVAVDNRSGEVLQSALPSLWRRKLLVLGSAAIAVVLGSIAVLVLPARYTAEAYIRGGFDPSAAYAVTKEEVRAGSISLDLMRVIETQSRWLQTQELARRVVQQLGLERLRAEVGETVNTPGEVNTPDKEDAAAARLIRRLSVTSDPRAYLIAVRYTTGDPDLAVRITNAFVAEVLRSTRLQTLFQQRAYTQARLSSQLARFGDKHPKVAELRTQLATMNDSLKRQTAESPESVLQTSGENVTKAVAAPSNPHPLRVVGLFVFVSLLLGAGAALWLERDRVLKPISISGGETPLATRGQITA
jgi:uncharacterized protein involved in exopolysaccharide biosynthesis